MVKHYIIMSSSYTDGVRVALDITEEERLNVQAIQAAIMEIRESCGNDVPLSTHLVETQSKDWHSVSAYDPFFEDVVCVKSTTDFILKIKEGRVLSGLDVAKYILTRTNCTHLSLEKLVYYAYADYLCAHSARLFEDTICAFKHGPIVRSVYSAYRQSGDKLLDPPDISLQTGVSEMPAKSRILFAIDGAEKLRSIDQTIQKYGHYSASTLVTLTHTDGAPWSRVDRSTLYAVIPDDLIRDYHHLECIQ